jgi:hypothetical protein
VRLCPIRRVRPGGRGLALVLDRNRLTRTAAERSFVLFGECGQVGVFWPLYWLAIALRGQRLSAALSSPASAARWLGLALLLARNRLTRTAAERGFVLSGECGQSTCSRTCACTDRLSASNRSEHGILGKRRLKLRSPAV